MAAWKYVFGSENMCEVLFLTAVIYVSMTASAVIKDYCPSNV